jgi:integrase
VVPGDRMKAAKLHRVPLSPAAVAVLEAVRPLMKVPGDLVFPGGRKNVPLSDMALSEVVRRMNEGGDDGAPPRWRDAEGRAVVPHGFRSTFRDWVSAAGQTRRNPARRTVLGS